MTVVVKTRYVDVVCPLCRLPRSITRRQARRITTGQADGRCRSCRHPQPERPRPDDMDRIYWLACFTDDEIAELAYFIFGGGDVEAVAAWRARLTLTAGGRAA